MAGKPERVGWRFWLSPPQQILLGIVLGAAVALPPSILQWLLVLRGQSTQAAWWVVASALSWAIGFAISFALGLAFGELTFIAGPLAALGLSGWAMVRILRAAPAPTRPQGAA